MLRSGADPNMYFRRTNGKMTVILLYVDDLLITGDDISYIKEIQTALATHFEMTDLDTAKLYLGIEFAYYPSGIFIHQRAYIRKLLHKYNLDKCLSSTVPMEPGLLLKKDTGSPKVNPELYCSMVGSLIYLTNTRPDISYAVSCVSRYMSNPEETHLQAAKQILCYLKGTIDFALHLSSESGENFHTFADADWRRDMDTRRSTSGIVYKLGETTVHWTSKLQEVVSLSTTEAEYRVLSEATGGILHLQKIFINLDVNALRPTPLLSDNTSCIRLVDNPVLHEKTKHIDIRAHFICEKARSGDVGVQYVHTSDQQADMLTKPLATTKFTLNRAELGLALLPS